MKQWVIRVLAGMILLVGLALIGYPVVSNLLFEKQQRQLADYYASKAEEVAPAERSSHWDECDAYNRMLAADASLITDPFASDLDPDTLPYAALLNLYGDGAMGVIEIPGIADNLVIYHGTKEDVLQKGVGHLQGSSLPVGGESTHTVLSAHCGLPSKKLFTNLDQLELGDVFYLRILGETLSYQVNQIKVVLPHETDDITIVSGEDYVTLVTCTPYGINSHRLLVRGTRIPNEEAAQLEATQQKKKGSTWQQQYLRAILMGLGLAVGLGLLIIITRRLKRRPVSADNNDNNDSNIDNNNSNE